MLNGKERNENLASAHRASRGGAAEVSDYTLETIEVILKAIAVWMFILIMVMVWTTG